MITRTKNRACGTKQRYASRRAANTKIAAMVRAKQAIPDTWDAYRCRHCGSWHTGHRGVRR
jgi:hypothetical protein